MSKDFSRRDFLKLAGVGAAGAAVLTGCGPASRYVTREQYLEMPEYNYNGQSTFYATTCRECAAACGIVVRTMQGRALKIEGNANHPVNLGKTCARGQASLHGLYNPDRVTDPIKRTTRGGDATQVMDWDAAIQTVADALKNHQPSEIAFLMGMTHDHLFDLVTELAKSTGINAPIRFGALGAFEARATLVKAAENIYGRAALPFFDIGAADVVFSFGANFLETWISPVAYTRGFSKMRKGKDGKHGYFVQFEARMSQTASKADEWIPIAAGTEGLVALALGKLAAQTRGLPMPRAFAGIDPLNVANLAGVPLATLERLAVMFANAGSAVSVAGGAALGQENGLATAESVLALNAVSAKNLVSFMPASPFNDEYHRPASMMEMRDLVQKMNDGKIKVLFVHGVNPLFELPISLGFGGATKYVEQIISFATFPDETAQEADYVFPDHHPLESWGYQRIASGAGQSALSGAQPVVAPYHNTRSTVDVLIAAARLAYADEYAFMQSKIGALLNQTDGSFSAADAATFVAFFQQHGGWWKTTNELLAPNADRTMNAVIKTNAPESAGEGEFTLIPFVSPTLGEAGANKPWLQELPDPTTTVMWNTWVEMNPKTAEELGIENDDVVLIETSAGAVEAPVYRYPAIRPDTIAIPFGQGHVRYGRFAQARGINPLDLINQIYNEAGDLAFAGMKAKVTKTGRQQVLSRLESRMGVYGEGMGEKE